MDEEEKMALDQQNDSIGNDGTQIDADQDGDSLTNQEYSQEAEDGAISAEDNTSESAESEEDSQVESEEVKQARGKLKQIQEENKRLKEGLTNTLSFIARDPQRYKQALMDMKGMTAQEAENEIARAKKQDPNLWKEVKADVQEEQRTGESPIDEIEQAIENHPIVAEMKRTVRLQREDLVKRFEDDKPALNGNFSPQANTLRRMTINLIADTTGKDPFTASLEEWNTAYQSVVDLVSGNDLKSREENARLQGMVEANNSNAGTRRAVSGSSTSTRDTSVDIQLTPEMRKVMSDLGLTEAQYKETYLKHKK